MTSFSADTLDLSRFPPPLAIRNVDFDAIRTASLARLGEFMTAAGIPWDVASLEANPAAIINRALSYREFMAYVAINDAVRSTMVAFAVGSDLDHLALTATLNLPVSQRGSLLRRVVTPATSTNPAVMESDAEFRRRVLLAPEAFAAAGPVGAYIFHALSADPRVLNVDVWSVEPGKVMVAVQSRLGDGIASSDLIEAVRAHLHRPTIKPLTDQVHVRSIVNVPYQIAGTGYVRPGPDRASVQVEAMASIQAMAAARRTPARDVPRSAIFAAASVGGIDKVTLDHPVEDVARGYGEVALPTSINFEVETYDG